MLAAHLARLRQRPVRLALRPLASAAAHESLVNWLRTQLLTRLPDLGERGGFQNLLDQFYPHADTVTAHQQLLQHLHNAVQGGDHSQFPELVTQAGEYIKSWPREHANLESLMDQYAQRHYMPDTDARIQAWLHSGNIPAEGDLQATQAMGEMVPNYGWHGRTPDVHPLISGVLSLMSDEPHGKIKPRHIAAMQQHMQQLGPLLAGAHQGHLDSLLGLMHLIRGTRRWGSQVTSPVQQGLFANAQARTVLGAMHAQGPVHDRPEETTPEDYYHLS